MYDLRYRTSREEGRNQDSRLKRFICWDTFLVTRVMRFDQHSVPPTITPRNLKQVTCSILQSYSWMSRLGRWILDLGEWMSMHLVFKTFSLRPLLDIHVFTMSRQDWRDLFSSLGSFPIMKMVVSSAKRTVESGGRASGKSFMKVEKRVGTERMKSLWRVQSVKSVQIRWSVLKECAPTERKASERLSTVRLPLPMEASSRINAS